MTDKQVAVINIAKALTSIPFTMLAAVGSASGNLLFAGLSVVPIATLTAYDTISNSMQTGKLRSQKEDLLELQMPSWWTDSPETWVVLCREIEERLPDILSSMEKQLQQVQEVVTKQTVRQAFIDAFTDEPFSWLPHNERKKVAASIATRILTKMSRTLQPIVVQIQQEAALKDIRDIRDNTRVIREAIKPSRLRDEESTRLHKNYCEALNKHWSMLDFKGIMHVDMNRPISIPLSEVFVLPDVLLGVPEYETLERENEQFVYGGYIRHNVKQISPQRRPLQQALASHCRLVLLGDPGSGKSTLLRYLLLQLIQGYDTFLSKFPELTDMARCIPLYIPLTAYAQVLLSNVPGSRSIEDFLPAYLHENYLGAYLGFIQEQLELGNLLLLFDGLDEIPDAALRVNVVRHIEMFTQTYNSNRFIVTSRIVGYKEAPLASEYQAYTLADFNVEQVKIFTQRWCPAYERWVKGNWEGQFLEGAATKEAERLFQATQSRPAVKRLAVNPLLLTILALIQRQGIDLPSHRIELFDLCALTLIDTWVKAKGQSTLFSRSDLVKILRPLAFWMHEHPAVGAIPEEELYEQVVRQLVVRSINEYEATKLAEQFLQTVRGKTGILVERGKERYGFLHLTFEEYFAARELEKRKDRNAFIKAHLHDPRWREVILLTVGSIGILQSNEEEVTDIVQDTVIRAGSSYEWALHRDLLFAGQCLADDVGVSAACENEIVEKIVYCFLTSPYDRLRDSYLNLLNAWGGSKLAEKAINLVLPIIQQWVTATGSKKIFSANSRFEQAFAEHFEHLVRGYQELMMKLLRFHLTIVLAHLEALDEVDWQENLLCLLSNPETKEKAANDLKHLNGEKSAVTEALLFSLRDPDAYVRRNVIIAMEQLGNTDSGVIDALLLALSDSDFAVRKLAARALGQLGDTQQRIIDALLDGLSDSDGICEQAVISLGELYEGEPRIVDALLTALADVDSCSIRKAAADSLARIGQKQARVTDALLIALVDSDEEVREAAANALGQLNNVNHAHVVDVLLSVISDNNEDSFQATAAALGQLSSNPPHITSALMLSISNIAKAKEIAIRVLGFLRIKQSPVIDTLLRTLLDANNDTKVRRASANALGHLGGKHAEVVDALLASLSDPIKSIRREAAKALGQLGEGQAHIIAELLNAISDTSSWTTRREATKALGRLDNGQQGVVDALLVALADLSSSSIRRETATALEGFGKAHLSIIHALMNSIPDYSDEVRKAAIYALKSLCKKHPDATNYLVSALSGSDYVQSAAEAYRKRLYTSVIERVLNLLKGLDSDHPSVIDLLCSLLSDSESSVRREAASTLGQLGKRRPQIVDKLRSLLSDPDWKIRKAAIMAFQQLGKGETSIFDGLLLALSDSDLQVRREASITLGRIGQEQPVVTVALLKTLSDSEPTVRAQAALALGRLRKSQPEVIDVLLQALFDRDDGGVRFNAAQALIMLKDGQPKIVEALLQSLLSASWWSGLGSAMALGQLAKEQTHVIDTLLMALSNPDLLVRASAVRALGSIGEKDPRVIDAMLMTLSDASWFVRAEAVRAFYSLGERHPIIVDGLLTCLSDTSSYVRAAAARSLRNVGREESRVINALIKAFSDTDWYVREEATFALANAQNERKIVGASVEELLKQYEPLAQRESKTPHPIFDALKEIAESG